MTISAVTAPTTQSAAGNDPLASLTSNLNDFLSLLMTQLQNQDPTTPMDSTQFTSQLVQFASVEQQLNINNGVQSLIQLSQDNEVLQSSALMGKSVTATSTQIPLQNGVGTLQFNTAAPESVTISVAASNGSVIQKATAMSAAGINTWTWNGQSSSGQQMPDGAYTVSVTGTTTGGATSTLPFTVTGTATGVLNQNNTIELQMGPLTLPFSAIQSVGS